MRKIIISLVILIFGINFSFAESNIKIFGKNKELFIERGIKVEKNIKLKNTTGKTITIKIEKVDMGNNFFSLSDNIITITPHKSYNYKYFINIGNKIKNKKLYGKIIFKYDRKIIYKKGGTYYKKVQIDYNFKINIIENLELNLLNLKKKLNNKRIQLLDKKIEKISDTRLIKISNFIDNINYKSSKYKKYENILNYINTKIKIKIDNNNIDKYSKIEKVLNNKNINKIHFKSIGEYCNLTSYIFVDNYLISYLNKCNSRNTFEVIDITKTNINLSTFLEKNNLKNIFKNKFLNECQSCTDGIDEDIIITYKGKTYNIDYDAISNIYLKNNKNKKLKELINFIIIKIN